MFFIERLIVSPLPRINYNIIILGGFMYCKCDHLACINEEINCLLN